jgi:glucose-1-phosphate adenylyltransferase
VDFVLSNLVNSGISTIYLLAQYKPESLIRHVARAWKPAFADSEGVIRVLLPRSTRAQFRGTADAVAQYLDLLQAHAPDIVAVFAADHVYRMDVRQMVAFHRAKRAAVTVSALAVPIEKASAFGVLGVDGEARVREFREKPKQPPAMPGNARCAYVSMGNYLFEPQALERVLQQAYRSGELDFGRDVLPRICGTERVYTYDFAQNEVPGVQDYEERAYWRDVGTLSALAAAQQDAMGSRPRFNLWNRRWPIRGEFDEATSVTPHAAWLPASRERHSDERVSTS